MSFYTITQVGVLAVVAAVAWLAGSSTGLDFSPLAFLVMVSLLIITSFEIPLIADKDVPHYSALSWRFVALGSLVTGSVIGGLCVGLPLVFQSESSQNPLMLVYVVKSDTVKEGNGSGLLAFGQFGLSAIINLAFQIACASVGEDETVSDKVPSDGAERAEKGSI